MLWLPTALVATIMGSLLLMGVYTFLYFQERTKFLLIWSIGWGVYAVRYIASFVSIYYPELKILNVVTQLAVLASVVLLLWGTRLFINSDWHQGWAISAAVIGVLVTYAIYAGVSLSIYSIPVFVFSAIVYIYTGIIFFKMEDRSNQKARQLTGAGFIVWGIHKLDYPFLRPLPAAAPWGYLVGALLELYSAIGILLVYFQKNRYELMLSEQRLSRLNAELEQRVEERTARLQESVQELEAFAYTVSHDLRAPLRAIGGFGEILLEEYEEVFPKEALDYLDRILINSSRMDELIRDLLMLAQLSKQEISFRQVDMTQLAEEVFQEICEIEEACERDIEFTAAQTLPVMADSKLMRVVMMNLISNAVKFTRDSHPAKIYFGARWENDQQVFFVRDNGIGFSMEFAEKIFLPFQRLHSGTDFEGTGIGLATVRRGIERQNGRVWAFAEEGQGATIYFTVGAA